ncbi:MAG TPA: GDSL-type esterase/lipase family protein [Bacteroidia bacterium]|nr:GDSL-type esterase/lipase family protein [Bacteroidia bacterium]HRS59949.1 GDSL-type esterase/lipase family protein [Bacteroidia bacterium]HRU69381.1 GDSL-type esterase/lipase family protein [Bacteroidia bacterium]
MLRLFLLLTFFFSGFSMQTFKNTQYQIIFLGDMSIGLANWSELLGREDVYYFSNAGSLTGNMRKYAASVASMKPKICFIMGGINDFFEGVPVQQVYQNIAGTVAELQVNGIIPVVHTALFVNDKYWKAYQLNPKIKDLNTLLIRYCKNSDIELIDLNSVLAPGNQLSEQYSSDGLRLNSTAYNLWAEKIKLVLKKYSI